MAANERVSIGYYPSAFFDGVGPHIQHSQVSLRFLFSSADAGVIIGRGGSNRAEIQGATRIRLQFSRLNDFFPGTSERILSASGTLASIIQALAIIIAKLYSAQAQARNRAANRGSGNELGRDAASIHHPFQGQQRQEQAIETDTPPDEYSTQLKLLLPAAACGVIIGPGGAAIRNTAAETLVTISLSPQDHNRNLEYERVATITGPWPGTLKALVSMLARVLGSPYSAGGFLVDPSTDASLAQGSFDARQGQPDVSHLAGQLATMAIQATPAASQVLYPRVLPQEQQQQFQGSIAYYQQQQQLLPMIGSPWGVPLQQPQQLVPQPFVAMPDLPQPATCDISFPVPGSTVGALIGRRGCILQQIKELFGVRIVIADKAQTDRHTNTRLVHIQGPPDKVYLAQQFIEQRLDAIQSERLATHML